VVPAVAGSNPVAHPLELLNPRRTGELRPALRTAVPLVIRSAVGARGSFGAIHSQNPATWFLGVPGLKIIAPSTPSDAKALLKAAIRDDSPVLCLEHKRLYATKGSWRARRWPRSARPRSAAPATT
jgi:pyruvate/2-oxoglutarate/acetoin dehydrogenase E1 component